MNLKSRILAIYLLLSSIGYSQKEIDVLLNNDKKVEIQDDVLSYDNGRIYIGDEAYLESLDDVNYFDVLVLDQRDSADPNMKIINSYRIVDNKDMLEILSKLIEYENNNPSNWDRTIKSMRNEWMYHNASFYLCYMLNNSKDVDLNNADEKIFQKKLIIK